MKQCSYVEYKVKVEWFDLKYILRKEGFHKIFSLTRKKNVDIHSAHFSWNVIFPCFYLFMFIVVILYGNASE